MNLLCYDDSLVILLSALLKYVQPLHFRSAARRIIGHIATTSFWLWLSFLITLFLQDKNTVALV